MHNYDIETLAVRAGIARSQFNEHSEALYLTSSFVFDNAAQAAARFQGKEPGNIYSRFTNPTVSAFQERLAALRGASAASLSASPTTYAETRSVIIGLLCPALARATLIQPPQFE